MSPPIRLVSCENPTDWIWEQLHRWENEWIARHKLSDRYRLLQRERPKHDAFKNVQSLMAYLQQARAIFYQRAEPDQWTDPLLIYYGMMSLMKAVVLTVDVDYPDRVDVLRHGLSTRKRKRQPYQFLQDEIRIQKEGLFPHILKKMNISYRKGMLYTPQRLLSYLPDLQPLYQEVTGETSLIPVRLHDGDDDAGMLFSIPEYVLDQTHLTPERWIERLNQAGAYPRFVLNETTMIQDSSLWIRWHHPQVSHVNEWTQGFDHPFFYENSKGDYYLWIGNNHLEPLPLPEWLAQYMLLFSISMLCRYDTPLWVEFLSTTKESVMIKPLLRVVRRTFPLQILQMLEGEKFQLRVR